MHLLVTSLREPFYSYGRLTIVYLVLESLATVHATLFLQKHPLRPSSVQ